MMTWDHIVPKSLDGSNNILNGRVACTDCNNNRGNTMTLHEIAWAAVQDPLVLFKHTVQINEKIPLALLIAAAQQACRPQVAL